MSAEGGWPAHEEQPQAGSKKDAFFETIWSASYGLSAKVNQSKKNLGAPPLPVLGFGLPHTADHFSWNSTWENYNNLSLYFKLLLFIEF